MIYPASTSLIDEAKNLFFRCKMYFKIRILNRKRSLQHAKAQNDKNCQKKYTYVFTKIIYS
jgi:hypothetical protein